MLTSRVYFYEKELFRKEKKLVERVAFFTLWQIFKKWLYGRQLDSHIYFYWQYVVLVKIYEENLA